MGLARLRIAILAATLSTSIPIAPVAAQPLREIRLGYLEQPGSALCLLAAANGLFRAEHLEVTLVRYRDSIGGNADLTAGKIDAGAFAVRETLQAIAGGGNLRIVAGGGVERETGLLEELDAAARQDEEDRGIVLVAGAGAGAPDKDTLVSLVKAIVRTDLLLQANPAQTWKRLARYPHWKEKRVQLDPNPDYWHLAELWKRHGLQREEMPRAFLSNHVYEEIYCDALDDLADGEGGESPALKKLISRAGCIPDCCPEKKQKKQLEIEGGAR